MDKKIPMGRAHISEFLSAMKSLGINIIDLHTSGHASAEDIELLKQTVRAEEYVTIHTWKADSQ